jgi:hypothetical protein
MQAICNHNLKFHWVNVKWPGSASDYKAWVTSGLCNLIENNPAKKLLAEGMTLVGDNAYVKRKYMAISLRGHQTGWKDGYNFSVSQIRITIERAFGVFVHRWAILRAPLSIPILKAPALVECLVRLHYFCIDCEELDFLNPSPSHFPCQVLIQLSEGKIIVFLVLLKMQWSSFHWPFQNTE